MRTCKFCTATLLNNATICKSCGRSVFPTRIPFAKENSLQTTHAHNANAPISIDISYSSVLPLESPADVQRGQSLWAYDSRASSQKESAQERPSEQETRQFLFNHPYTSTPFLARTQPAEKPPTAYRGIGLLTAIMILVVVFSSIVGFEFGRLTPVIRLEGATHVTLGDLLHVQGQNFIAGETVILTRDKSSPLGITLRPTFQTIHTKSGVLTIPAGTQETISGNTLTLGNSGTFDVTILVNDNWGIGRHTIQASEQFGLLRTEISFNVLQPPNHLIASMIISSERTK